MSGTGGSALLRVARALCRLPVPGRYTFARLVAPLVGPSGRLVERLPGGMLMDCDLGDDIEREVAFGIYEPHESRVFRSRLKRGDVVVDVGANVGYYALLAAGLVGPGGAVHAFEPVPTTFAKLAANVRLNRTANVTVNQAAVGDGSAPTLTLYKRDRGSNAGSPSIVRSPSAVNEPFEVEAVTLDEYVDKAGIAHVDLVKMDVEGAEPYVLRGARRLLSADDAPDLLFEVNTFLLGIGGSDPMELVRAVEEHGYRAQRIGATSLQPIDPAEMGQPNHVLNVFATKRG